MTATEDLRAEHEGVLSMLRIMQAVILRLRTGAAVPRAHLEAILEFLKIFADRCHHGKEEDILFPALEAAGVSRDSGPIGVMLREHSLGRRHIRAMETALESFGAAESDASPITGESGSGAQAFATAAQDYVDLLSQHIAKENNQLFVMAERLLGPDTLTRMHATFERLERERIGPGRHEAFHRLLNELSAQYLSS